MFIKTTRKKNYYVVAKQEKGEACFLKCMNILSNGPSKKRRGGGLAKKRESAEIYIHGVVPVL